MDNSLVKNETNQEIKLVGHKAMQPGESRPFPKEEAEYLARTPGLVLVSPERSTGEELSAPKSKSEARRLSTQRDNR